MKYRIQPKPIDIPEDNPFENDRLNRGGAAEIMTELVSSIEGPCVIALDAPWGMGKTTFLNMWKRTLQNKRIPVAMFNAWETDFSDEPFVALSEELHKSIQSYTGTKNIVTDDLKDAAFKVAEVVGFSLPQILISSLVGSASTDIIMENVSDIAKSKISQYEQAKEVIWNFRKKLQVAACKLSETSESNTPLVVIIDELDRCRPSYAIELLEILKHLFAVDGVVFLLAINHKELIHFIKAIYGTKFNAEIYLRRFIDIDIHLPEANREVFIDSTIDTIESQLEDSSFNNEKIHRLVGFARDWLRHFFGTSDVDLRTVEQALHRLELILAMFVDDHMPPILTATFVLIFRTVDPDLYHRFLQGQAGDREVADTLFERVGYEYRTSNEGCGFETEIIMATIEDHLPSNTRPIKTKSDLLSAYTAASREDGHAGNIIVFVDNEINGRTLRGERRMPFKDSVHRLEMLSDDLNLRRTGSSAS